MSSQLVLCSTYNVSCTVNVECGLCTLESILGEDRETMCYHCTQLQEKNFLLINSYYGNYHYVAIRIGRASVAM